VKTPSEKHMCNNKNDNSFLIGIIVGGALGAVFGYLTAPAPGEESRKKLAQTATKYYDEGKVQAQKAKASFEKIKEDATLTAERAEGIYSELSDEVKEVSDELKEVSREIKEKVGPLIQQAEEASFPLREEIKEKIGQLVEEVEEKVKEERKNSKKRMFSGVK
jgi:gas vesicle protein